MANHIETFFVHTTDEGVDGKLGIDNKGKLYWNDKAVVTEQRITLRWWVNVSIVVGSISTLVLAIAAIIQCY